MTIDDTERPRYWHGQYLRARDFVDEQAYHRAMRRRLNLGATTWGIVTGLELIEQPRLGSSAVDLMITTGMAVDGNGCEIFVFSPVRLPIAEFQRFPTPRWVPVWLRYQPEQAAPPPYGYEACDDTEQSYRVRETYRIEVGPFSPSHDPVVIDGAPVQDADLPVDLSVPHQALPEDDERAVWRVPIGFANWNAVDGFTKSAGAADDEQRRAGRVLIGAVAATAWAPEGRWELRSRGRAAPAPAPVQAAVRGALDVDGLLAAHGQPTAVRVTHGALAFTPPTGNEATVPLRVSRFDRSDGADLRVQLGQDTAGKTRLAIRSGTTDQVLVTDGGDVVIHGGLTVDKVIDVSPSTGDRLLLSGTAGNPSATAVGSEDGGARAFARSPGGMRWYLDRAPGNVDDAALELHSGGVRLRRDLIVGWGDNGRLGVRHVDGKRYDSDAGDDLFLNWETGNDVVVGNLGGTPSDLRVSGNIYLGPNQLQLKAPIDVVVGRRIVNFTGPAGGIASGSFNFQVTSNLPQANTIPNITVSLGEIRNTGYAVDAGWRVAGVVDHQVSDRTWEFRVIWEVRDDGSINEFSYVVVFFP
jgi:hypothetical protein